MYWFVVVHDTMLCERVGERCSLKENVENERKRERVAVIRACEKGDSRRKRKQEKR